MHLTALCRTRVFDTILLFDHAPRRYTPLVHCRRGAAPLAYSIGYRLPLRLLYGVVFSILRSACAVRFHDAASTQRFDDA